MKWEYKTLEIGKAKGTVFHQVLSADPLNELGKDGWELTSAVAIGGSAAYDDQVFLIFKRPTAE